MISQFDSRTVASFTRASRFISSFTVRITYFVLFVVGAGPEIISSTADASDANYLLLLVLLYVLIHGLVIIYNNRRAKVSVLGDADTSSISDYIREVLPNGEAEKVVIRVLRKSLDSVNAFVRNDTFEKTTLYITGGLWALFDSPVEQDRQKAKFIIAHECGHVANGDVESLNHIFDTFLAFAIFMPVKLILFFGFGLSTQVGTIAAAFLGLGLTAKAIALFGPGGWVIEGIDVPLAPAVILISIWYVVSVWIAYLLMASYARIRELFADKFGRMVSGLTYDFSDAASASRFAHDGEFTKSSRWHPSRLNRTKSMMSFDAKIAFQRFSWIIVLGILTNQSFVAMNLFSHSVFGTIIVSACTWIFIYFYVFYLLDQDIGGFLRERASIILYKLWPIVIIVALFKLVNLLGTSSALRFTSDAFKTDLSQYYAAIDAIATHISQTIVLTVLGIVCSIFPIAIGSPKFWSVVWRMLLGFAIVQGPMLLLLVKASSY